MTTARVGAKSRGSQEPFRLSNIFFGRTWKYECFLCGLNVTGLTSRQCFVISDNHNSICTQERK